MHDPSTSLAAYRIHCPYCNTPFCLTLEKTDNTILSLTPTDEVMALPYARDVDIFDPPADHTNSRWSPIGEDFFGGIKYDRWLGILRIPPDLKVYYCVARCPACGTQTQDQVNNHGKQGLIDVFANLTSDRRLSAIWPQLFSDEPHQRPCPAKRDTRAQEFLSPKALHQFVPRDFISRLFNNHVTVAAFLMILYVGSFMPDIVTAFDQTPFTFDAFLTDHFSALLIRGIMVVSLFLLIAVRQRLIRSYTDKRALSKLFKIHDNEIGLIYWMNWAVSRFTGYQKSDGSATMNAVLFFGGVLSSVILIVAWALSNTGILPPGPQQTVYAMCAEMVFWLIISFLFGVIVWNQFETPRYILPSLDRIPMRTELIQSFTRNFGIIIRIGIYSGCAILLLCATFIAVAIIPILIPGFPEPQWIVVWAEFALVVFSSIIIIRFLQTRTVNKVLLVVVVVLTYLLLKFWIPYVGLTKVSNVGQYGEILLISCLAGGFFSICMGLHATAYEGRMWEQWSRGVK